MRFIRKGLVDEINSYTHHRVIAYDEDSPGLLASKTSQPTEVISILLI